LGSPSDIANAAAKEAMSVHITVEGFTRTCGRFLPTVIGLHLTMN
jgi:hypothetical protein